jgi:hypothetical protein
MPLEALSGARASTWIAAALIAMHALLAWTQRVVTITTGNDDAVYLLLARSLRGGQYRDLFLVGTPVHSQYPPGYPALLAILGAPATGDLALVVAVNILLSCAALALMFDVVRRLSPFVALLALAALALNPALVSAASHVQSEPLFMALTMLAVWGECTRGPKGESARRTTVIIAAAVAGALVRSAGIAIIAGILVHWLLQRRWRRAGALAVATALFVGPWIAWTAIAPGKYAGRSYVADAMLVTPATAARDSADRTPLSIDPGDASGSTPIIRMLAARVMSNVPLYLNRRLPTQLGLPTVGGVLWDNVLWLLLITAGGISGILLLWRKCAVIVPILLCYCGLLLLWPYALGRYLTPVLPLIVAALIQGLWRLGALLVARGDHAKMRWIPFALPAGLAVVLTASGASSRFQARALVADCELPGSCNTRVSDSRYIHFVNELESSLPINARVFTSKEGAFYYLTGRRVVPIYPALGLGSLELQRYLTDRHVTAIVLTHLKIDEWQLAAPLSSICTDLTLISADPPELLALSNVPPGSSQTDACAALDAWSAAW